MCRCGTYPEYHGRSLFAGRTEKGAYLKEKIEKMPHVENVAGLGMMLGIQLDVEAKPVINALLEAGLLVLSAKTKIRLLPP